LITGVSAFFVSARKRVFLCGQIDFYFFKLSFFRFNRCRFYVRRFLECQSINSVLKAKIVKVSLFGHENDEMKVKKLNIHFFIFLKKALIVLCGKHEKFDSKYVGLFLTCHSSRSLTRYFFSLFLIQ